MNSRLSASSQPGWRSERIVMEGRVSEGFSTTLPGPLPRPSSPRPSSPAPSHPPPREKREKSKKGRQGQQGQKGRGRPARQLQPGPPLPVRGVGRGRERGQG